MIADLRFDIRPWRCGMKSNLAAGACGVMLALGVSAVTTSAQTRTSGIYMSAADYAAQRLSWEGDCQSSSNKLNLHNVLVRPYVDVSNERENKRFLKMEIYGARTCSGREYRFGDDRDYEVRERGPIPIYTFRVRSGKYGRPEVYFFSAGPAGTVQQLKKDNLKRAFSENPRFLEALEKTFSSDSKLNRFDDSHKMFVINRLWLALAAPEP